MRHGFAETNWQMATTLSSSVSSKTANDSADHAGRLFRTAECNNLSCFIAGLNAQPGSSHTVPWAINDILRRLELLPERVILLNFRNGFVGENDPVPHAPPPLCHDCFPRERYDAGILLFV